MNEDRRIQPGYLAGLLLILASALLAAGELPGAPAAVTIAAFALVGAGIAIFSELRLRSRRFGSVLMTIVLVAIGETLAAHGVAADHLWAVPSAFAVYLAWTAFACPVRTLRVAVPSAIIAVAVPLAQHVGVVEALTTTALVLPIAGLAALATIPRTRAERARRVLQQRQDDLDAVVMANLELRHVSDAAEAARRVARIATELLGARGAVVWVQGPGSLLCAGGHGVTPEPDRAVIGGSGVERCLLTGSVETEDDEIVLPLTGSGGVFGAVIVHGPTRTAESFVASLLQVLGTQAGASMERLRAVESLIDIRYVDPVTGVGNRLAATASLATLHTGDAVLLLAIDDLDEIRAREGDARADLTLGQLGLHLRTATRAGDVVARFDDDVLFLMLRDLTTDAESVVTRIVDSWQQTGTSGRLRAGAALHFGDLTPLDTLDRASDALIAARADDGRPQLAASAELAAWGPR